MSFFDRAKAAATDLAAKADQAMSNAGIAGSPMGAPPAAHPGASEADGALRDYGLILWREQHGHPIDATERERVVGVLRRLDGAGQLAALRVGAPPPPTGGGLFGGPSTAPPPPPPGAAAAAHAAAQAAPAPPATTPPPPAPAATPPPPAPSQTSGGSSAPPPPPSWA